MREAYLYMSAYCWLSLAGSLALCPVPLLEEHPMLAPPAPTPDGRDYSRVPFIRAQSRYGAPSELPESRSISTRFVVPVRCTWPVGIATSSCRTRRCLLRYDAL